MADFFVDKTARRKIIKKLLSQGYLRKEQIRLKRKDGSIFWGAVTMETIYDDVGSIMCLQGIVDDIP